MDMADAIYEATGLHFPNPEFFSVSASMRQHDRGTLLMLWFDKRAFFTSNLRGVIQRLGQVDESPRK